MGPLEHAELRYDELPPEPEEPFERTWALDCVERALRWAEGTIGGGDPNP